MPFDDDKKLRLISFPKHTLTEADKQMLIEQSNQIHDVCVGTSRAVEALHQQVAKVLFDLLTKLDLDCWTLCQILDEKPSVVRGLMESNPDSATMERMMEMLEQLRA